MCRTVFCIVLIFITINITVSSRCYCSDVYWSVINVFYQQIVILSVETMARKMPCLWYIIEYTLSSVTWLAAQQNCVFPLQYISTVDSIIARVKQPKLQAFGTNVFTGHSVQEKLENNNNLFQICLIYFHRWKPQLISVTCAE